MIDAAAVDFFGLRGGHIVAADDASETSCVSFDTSKRREGFSYISVVCTVGFEGCLRDRVASQLVRLRLSASACMIGAKLWTLGVADDCVLVLRSCTGGGELVDVIAVEADTDGADDAATAEAVDVVRLRRNGGRSSLTEATSRDV